MVTIYTLSAKKVGVFYVGKTSMPLKIRLRCHFADLRVQRASINLEKNKVFRQCIASKDYVLIEPIEILEFNNKAAKEAEAYWISQLSALGFTLTNKYKLTYYKYIPKRLGRRATYYKKRLIKQAFNENEKVIIAKLKKPGDAKKISKICGKGEEMIRLCINGRVMRTEIYEAIKDYYKFLNFV